jgi:hypothetical protein
MKQKGKENKTQASRQDSKKTGYGDKKLVGENRPAE